MGETNTAEVEHDFGGWATKANVRCSDGRTIMPDAFKHQDGEVVPLVWAHGSKDQKNILGYAVLRHQDEGVRCEAFFNDTAQGIHAKKLVRHKDIRRLSIHANQLIERSKAVFHGMIREVSLVVAGANDEAKIDFVAIKHSDGTEEFFDDEAIIHMGIDIDLPEIDHEDDPEEDEKEVKPEEDEQGADEEPKNLDEEVEHGAQEVYDSMSEDQKKLLHYMVGAAQEGEGSDDESSAEHSGTNNGEDNLEHQEGTNMTSTRNAFEANGAAGAASEHELSHDEFAAIVAEARDSKGSYKKAMQTQALEHGINDLELLFPDAHNLDSEPQLDKRRTEWVADVLGSVKRVPWSRVKNIWADLTQEDARAKGYIKGTFKKEEWFGLMKRTTSPATVYKKQKLDRDDLLDITEYNVVSFLKREIRLMLEEEVARAILIGDGREVDDEDKIKDPNGASDGAGIRSILNDHDLYVATVTVPNDADWTEVVDAVLEAKMFYKGTGTPAFYTTLPQATKMLLVRDGDNKRMYRSRADLASEMGVDRLVDVEVMEEETDVIGIMVNLTDYSVGTDRGGEITSFEDFDIDFNQHKYLQETRLSGGLTKIRSAVVIRRAGSAQTLATPVAPTFDEADNEVTVATTTGITYKNKATGTTLTTGAPVTLSEGQTLTVVAVPASGSYYIPNNVNDEWTFSYQAA